MVSLNSIPRKMPGIIARRAGDEYILVPVTDNIADMTCIYTLNETGAFLWDHIDGSATVEDLARELAEEYDGDIETTRNDVMACLADLEKYLITER